MAFFVTSKPSNAFSLQYKLAISTLDDTSSLVKRFSPQDNSIRLVFLDTSRLDNLFFPQFNVFKAGFMLISRSDILFKLQSSLSRMEFPDKSSWVNSLVAQFKYFNDVLLETSRLINLLPLQSGNPG